MPGRLLEITVLLTVMLKITNERVRSSDIVYDSREPNHRIVIIKNHKRAHIRVKPYSCNQCDNFFREIDV